MQFTASRKERLYGELEKLLRAGFSIDDAARAILERKPAPPADRYLEGIRRGLASGQTVGEAVAGAGVDLTSLELSLVVAAERGGRMDEAYGRLSEYFGLMDRTRKRILSSLIYPVVLLHVAIILPAIPKAILAGDGGLALKSIFGTLLVVYSSAGIIAMIGRTLSLKAREDPGADRFLRAIPLLGGARRSLSLSRFCQVFRIHLLAALPITNCLRASGQSSQSGMVVEATENAARKIEGGASLATAIHGEPAFPAELASSLSTAELSGTLDVDLAKWERVYRESSVESLGAVSGWFPKVLYVLVVFYVCWQILTMGLGYLGALEDHLQP